MELRESENKVIPKNFVFIKYIILYIYTLLHELKTSEMVWGVHIQTQILTNYSETIIQSDRKVFGLFIWKGKKYKPVSGDVYDFIISAAWIFSQLSTLPETAKTAEALLCITSMEALRC